MPRPPEPRRRSTSPPATSSRVRELRDGALFSTPGKPDPRRVWWTFSSFDPGDAAEVVAAAGGDAADAGQGRRHGGAGRRECHAELPGQRRRRDRPRRRAAARRLEPRRGDRRSRARRARARRARRSRPGGPARRRGARRSRSRASPTSCRPTPTRGFEVPEAKLALLTESEFYGRAAGYDARQVKKLATRRRNVVDPLQLKTGDYVVHQTHGIGKFVELTQREVSSGSRPTGPSRSAGSPSSPRGARVPRARVRAVQARLRRATSSSCRPTSSTCSRRYVGGEAPALSKMGGSDWAAGEGPRAQGRARHRRRARQALLGAHGGQGARVRRRHPVAARARGGVPVRRDARPAADHRRGEGRHGAADPDGPPALRRRRLRQDRGRRARRVQGHPGRQAGRDARADDAARQAALRDVQRAVRRIPRAPAGAQPVPDRQGGARDHRTASPTAPSTW